VIVVLLQSQAVTSSGQVEQNVEHHDTVVCLSTEVTEKRDALVASWHFDEGSGTTAGDSSGNNNEGTLVDNAQWAKGRIDSALQFDGAGDYVNVPDSSNLDLDTEATFAAWVYPQSGGNNIGVFEKVNTDDTDASFMLYLGVGEVPGMLTFRPHIMTVTSGWRYGAINFEVEPNNWYHVAYTFKSSTGELKGYVNGEEYPIAWSSQPVVGNTIRNSAQPMRIGTSVRTGAVGFTGLLDEVKVYSRALSVDEIKADMNCEVRA
ncbi:MAG: LamG domain-containing protein, partial [Candidatus Micrarchaeia archaeon]